MPLHHILGHINLVHIATHYLFMVHFKIILLHTVFTRACHCTIHLSKLTSTHRHTQFHPKWLPNFRFSDWNIIIHLSPQWEQHGPLLFSLIWSPYWCVVKG